MNKRKRFWLAENIPANIPVEINFGLSGYFEVRLIDAVTGVTKQELKFKNLLTDGFMDGVGSGLFSLGVGDTGFVHLAVGTGNSTPNFTNTTLDAEIARTNNNGGIVDILNSNSSPEYGYVRRTRVFTTAQANGNLREVGFFTQSSGGTLLNRALFRDSAGNPTTVTKTNQDILVIVYEWRLSAPLIDQTGTLRYFNDTQSSDWILRPQGVNQLTHWVLLTYQIGDWNFAAASRVAAFSDSTFFNSRTGLNTPTNRAISQVNVETYVPGTFTRDVRYVLSVLDGNYTDGIGLFVFTPWDMNLITDRFVYQMSFTPPLPKNETKQLDVTIRYSWQRV